MKHKPFAYPTLKRKKRLNYKPLELTVQETVLDYQILTQAGACPVIIDVREQWEWEIVALPQSLHIPLGRLFEEGLDLNHHVPLFTLCHHGMRSLKAAQWLKAQGFIQVQSIKGGIEEWACQIDKQLKRY